MVWTWYKRDGNEIPYSPPPLKKKEEKIKKENSSHSNTKSKDT